MATKAELEHRILTLTELLDDAAIQTSSAFHAMQEMAIFARINAGLRVVMNITGTGQTSVLVIGRLPDHTDAAQIAAVFTRTLEKLQETFNGTTA